MQFNIDETFDNLDSPPSIIDISSESGEEFVVEPGDIQALDERFRVGGPSADAMSAFVRAAAATLFPSSAVPYQNEETIDTAGSQIERQLMELVEEHQSNDSASPPSFIDTEFEESPEFQTSKKRAGICRSIVMAVRPRRFYPLQEAVVEVGDLSPAPCRLTRLATHPE